eukprot:CAMPEP_0172620660 /NCGR_PEP_ID=MMETSP1068-20121228/105149_1 /TAXON_ID=35684 /ORGANISM="Pseudopedinella elastica, Strain CCMP716" /LENGTH=82 /DNA_ID=CAMNT_0013428009 /DNA_START=287 /DNA_END=535 /DNA_ORIENTATION=-
MRAAHQDAPRQRPAYFAAWPADYQHPLKKVSWHRGRKHTKVWLLPTAQLSTGRLLIALLTRNTRSGFAIDLCAVEGPWPFVL